MKFTALKTRRTERLVDELERLQRQITERACEIFRKRGTLFGAALDDWLAGLLRITVAIAVAKQAKTVEVKVA